MMENIRNWNGINLIFDKTENAFISNNFVPNIFGKKHPTKTI